MNITFLGAVREVTGSMHLLTTEHDRILLDCGIYQGRRKESAEKNRVLPFDPRILTNVVLSHAHIDHSGRIPLLVKNGFAGRVITTRATVDACSYLLPDSGHIQESDADYLNYKTVRSSLTRMKNQKKGHGSAKAYHEIKSVLKKGRHELNVTAIADLMEKYHLKGVEPLYSVADAQACLELFDGNPYRHPVAVGKEATCTLYDAGHILGSAVSVIRAKENGRSFTICFTGDIGRFGSAIIKDPTLNFDESDRSVDLLIMESTYGDRIHEPIKDLKPLLKTVLNETFDRKGTVIIPSFAYGRTQELIYVLHELYNGNEVPRIPIYIDSPLATQITRVFGEHPEVYDRETHETFLENGQNPFSFKEVRFVGSVEESMALNRDKTPHIVISASGMCEAGRILHHLRHKIHDPKNTLLIVGYMAANTLGRRILEQGLAYEKTAREGKPPELKILNKTYPLKARVVKIGGFSAHGDKQEMLRFLKESNLKIKRIALVHGEEEQTLSFADTLKQEGFSTVVPRVGETLTLR